MNKYLRRFINSGYNSLDSQWHIRMNIISKKGKIVNFVTNIINKDLRITVRGIYVLSIKKTNALLSSDTPIMKKTFDYSGIFDHNVVNMPIDLKNMDFSV